MARKPAKKAVLNVTIDEHLAAEARLTAALANTTISSVVEQALAEQLKWERIRRDGLKAIDEYYQEHGYPTEEEMAGGRRLRSRGGAPSYRRDGRVPMEAERRSRYRTRDEAPGTSVAAVAPRGSA